jgi:hypothetical protein
MKSLKTINLSLDNNILDCLDNIAFEFLDSNLVKEYKRLNKIVEEKYLKEIMLFNNAKEQLLEASKYKHDLSSEQAALSRTKEVLFSKDEVKLLKEKEAEIQRELDKLSNDISSHLSNKFRKKRII